jgi:hypothetical protein
LGGGVVFKITNCGKLTVLHNFLHQDFNDGWLSAAGLCISDGWEPVQLYVPGQPNE